MEAKLRDLRKIVLENSVPAWVAISAARRLVEMGNDAPDWLSALANANEEIPDILEEIARFVLAEEKG